VEVHYDGDSEKRGREAERQSQTWPGPPANKSPGPNDPNVLPPPAAPPGLAPDRNRRGTPGRAQQDLRERDEPVPDRNARNPGPI
jgi:hypothetical protein